MTVTKKLVPVRVVDLYVQCSFPIVDNAIAMSDCCRKPATTAVDSPEVEGLFWRCRGHRGRWRGEVYGNVYHSVMRPAP